jgi:hypothetical protein
LDYVKDSERWNRFVKLYPNKVSFFKERVVGGQVFMSDLQIDHNNHHCRNLDMTNGRCTIHESNPFSCEFELNKVTTSGSYKRTEGFESHVMIIKKLFGRGWALTKIDGTKGALCTMTPFSYEEFLRDIELFKELQSIMHGFGKINKKLDLFIDHLETNKENYKDNRLAFTDVDNKIVITDDGVTTMKEYKKYLKDQHSKEVSEVETE